MVMRNLLQVTPLLVACSSLFQWEGVALLMATVCHSLCTIPFGLQTVFSHVVYSIALKFEAAGFSEMSVCIYQIAFCHILEVSNLDYNISSLSLQFGESFIDSARCT
jgi:hypothetical protein